MSFADNQVALLSTMGLGAAEKKGPILIVVPRGLLGQWYNDLTTKLDPSPTVCVYRKRSPFPNRLSICN